MKGGEGRRMALTWMQEQKRSRELSETAKKYAALPQGVREVIAKAAGVDDVSLLKLSPHQRRAMRNEAEKLFMRLDSKARTAQRAFLLLVSACTVSEV